MSQQGKPKLIIPAGLYYTETDEWVKTDGNTATLGITDYAQKQLSDIVFFEAIPSAGDSISKGEQIGTVESVKSAADINSPVSGTVAETNQAIVDSPEMINTSPYDAAWMIKIEMDDASGLGALMNADAYKAYCLERSPEYADD